MKHLILCAAISLLTPSLLASTANSSLYEPNQHECSNLPHESATKSLSFNDLPLGIKGLVLQHVPLSCPLVCHEWVQITEKRRALELEVFLKKAAHFEALFDSDKVITEVGYIEGHFNTFGGMHRMLSRIIASSYERVSESAKVEGDIYLELDSSESFINQRVEDFLENNHLLSMFSGLLLRSENHKRLLLDVLNGEGNFQEIPLKVRQFVARKIWYHDGPHKTACRLSSFLSSFHNKFDMFKDSLVNIDPNIIAKACVEIALEINCTMPNVDDRMRLLESIKQLFSDNSLIQTACLFCEKLSPSSPISEIHNVVKEYQALKGIAFDVLESSSEHATAMWCKRKLGLKVSFLRFNVDSRLLFSNTFLEKHQLLEYQSKLLEGFNADSLLCSFPDDLTGLDIKALVEWVKQDLKRKRTLSLSTLVMLYSLDDDKDALSNYSESLSEFKYYGMEWLEFSRIALGIEYGRRLNRDKKAALLQLLYPEQSDIVVAYLNGDRKELFVKAVSLIDARSYKMLIHYISESDFSLLVEAFLEHSEIRNVRPLCFRESKLAVQVLLKHIGDDVEKMAGLQRFSKYYQAMVFLLTDYDRIADTLSKSKVFERLKWKKYFPNIHSDWKAMRAAKRIHEYQTREPQQHQ